MKITLSIKLAILSFVLLFFESCGNGAADNKNVGNPNPNSASVGVPAPVPDTTARPDAGKGINGSVTNSDNSLRDSVEQEIQGDTLIHKKHKKRHHHKNSRSGYEQDSTDVDQSTTAVESNKKGKPTPPPNTNIPAKVYSVLKYVLANGKPMPGYVGGRVFTNFEKVLPFSDANGRTIVYHEWDVNPHIQGVNRGAERLVTGDNKKAYYTNDHYVTFTELKY